LLIPKPQAATFRSAMCASIPQISNRQTPTIVKEFHKDLKPVTIGTGFEAK
jgi:hypothetical protein